MVWMRGDQSATSYCSKGCGLSVRYPRGGCSEGGCDKGEDMLTRDVEPCLMLVRVTPSPEGLRGVGGALVTLEAYPRRNR